ncbi:MAG: site-specific integrase [Bacteroidaceae bacterium]|nr:site-specific integrase [Bacteroidaceae bacterium]
MTSIKVKFRASKNKQKAGTIYYQIIHNRVVRQQKTDYYLFAHEWDDNKGVVVITNGERLVYLQSIQQRIGFDIKRLQEIILKLESRQQRYTVDDVIDMFRHSLIEKSLFNFMHEVIVQLQQMGRLRTSETYRATLRSFMHFRENSDIFLDEFTPDLMIMYEAYLHNRGLIKNSTSFYMRILRAVYNRAVEKGIVDNQYPFKHVYTGIDKTVKRAISLRVIKQIKKLDLSSQPSLCFARDMFLFSFYTRGMSFIDMAYLRKKDLCQGVLSYRRRKTGQQLFIKWERCMQTIVTRYNVPQSEYLLPIIKPQNGDERRQYQNAMYQVNRKLKIIGKMVNLQQPLTLYAARHSWASIAKNNNIPISVISKGMGHDSEMTTQIYLASLDSAVVDRANSMIIRLL